MVLDIKGQLNLGEAAAYAAYDNQVLRLDHNYIILVINHYRCGDRAFKDCIHQNSQIIRQQNFYRDL